jgi:CDP-glucose 4,6-dehydratase
MEDLVMDLFADIYRGRRVLVTGHTGFKGSWLALWLNQIGAQVTGLALQPDTTPNHWEMLQLDVSEHYCDIRNASTVAAIVAQEKPEIVFHLAAQSLVRRSYRNPLDTWSSNVMGTANILDACRQTTTVRAVVIVTTDKVYDNQERPLGYCESDRLGGHDPYSASKAATELVAASYRDAFFQRNDSSLVATARAGNVIGGGDWSEDRLIPDMLRAVLSGKSLEIRSPRATRPWQHVLECLSGYLLLGQHLLQGRRECSGAWNFGPDQDNNCTVTDMLAHMRVHWPELTWHLTEQPKSHEANLLYLDISKAKDALGWHPVWSLSQSLAATAEWYRHYAATGRVESRNQLTNFINSAHAAGSVWCR